MRRFIPWILEPDPGIRQRRKEEAERELLRIAGVILKTVEVPEDMPMPRWFFGDGFCENTSNERRQQSIGVAVERRVIFPHGRRLNRGEAIGWFCDVNGAHVTKCADSTDCHPPTSRECA